MLALGEGHGRAARAGVEHRNVRVEVADEFLDLGLVAAELAVCAQAQAAR